MARVAGLCSLRAAEHAPWLEPAVSLMRHRAGMTEARWELPSLAVSAVSLGSADASQIGRHEAATIFFIGDLLNLPDVCQAYGQRAEGCDAAGALVQLYLRHGLRPFHDLNGGFLIGIWDARQPRLHLMTDRLSLCKTYVTRVHGALLFASEVKALLAHPRTDREVDPEALEHMLSLGYLAEDRTLYAAIRLLSGGTLLTYDPHTGSLECRSYWQPEWSTQDNRRSLEECADEMAQRLESAVRRRIGAYQRIALPLSGGLDSRTLLGLARRVAPAGTIEAYTAGHDHSFDVRFGRELARRCDARHKFLPLPEDFLAQWADSFAWLTDGMATVHHAWMMAVRRALAPETEVLLTGFFGDTPTQSRKKLLPFLEMEPFLEAASRAHRYVATDEEIRTLLRPAVFQQVGGGADRAFRRCLQAARVDRLPDRERVANVMLRQQRGISYQVALLGSAVPTRAPFTDNDVLDFSMTIPLQYRINRTLLQTIICRTLPQLAGVPNDINEGVPLNAGRLQRGLYWRWERLYKKQLPQWTGGLIARHERRAYAHHGEWMRQEPVRSYLTRTFAEQVKYLEPWFNAGAVQQLLQRHLEGPADLFRQVSAVLTLMAWFRQAEQLRPVAMPRIARQAA